MIGSVRVQPKGVTPKRGPYSTPINNPGRRLPQGRQLHPLQLQRRLAGTLGNGAWGYIVGTYDKDAGTNNQRLYLNGTRVAQMSDTQPLDLNSNPLGIGRHVTGVADPFNGHIDAFRISHIQRSDGWIQTTWYNMSDPGAFAAAGTEEQKAASRHRLPALG
jgi:Concanavalin A-like lectin/glucanases superfamily